MHSDLIANTDPHLDAIAKQAFEILAGMAPEPSVANDQKENFEVEAWVSYDGVQKIPRTLLLTTNAQFAVEFSRRFLGMPSLAEVNDDVLDAMGELANTVGGNFKGLFSVDTILSTPVVSKVTRNCELYPARNMLAELMYAFGGGGLCLVRLLGPHERELGYIGA